MLHAQRHAGVDSAHGRELQEVLRPALDVRAGIEQHRGAGSRRDGRRKRRPIDARQQAEARVGSHDRRAGAACAEHGHRPSVGDGFGREPDRGARLAPERLSGRLGHADHVRRIEDGDVERDGIGVPGELTLDHLTRAGQEQAEGQVPGGLATAPSMIGPGA